MSDQLEQCFWSKAKEAERNLHLVGDKFHADIYGAHLKAMQSLPKGWLPMNWGIRIAIAGQTMMCGSQNNESPVRIIIITALNCTLVTSLFVLSLLKPLMLVTS